MSTLGNRIRTLRKQQKMTLEALAGTELTKGMLSLIENNKANPSMESLHYIANRLNIDVTELLGEVSGQEIRKVLEKTEMLFNTPFYEVTDEYQQLIDLIAPYVPKLTQGYEAARLLEIYSRCLIENKIENSEALLNRAATMYEQMNLTAKRGEIGMFYATIEFKKHNYQGALNTLLRERAQLEENPLWIDPLSRLDYDYLESALFFAVGDYEKAILVMDKAIEYSNTNKIFNKVDNLYRLAIAHAMMSENEQKMDMYIKKLTAYSEFTDDQDSIRFTLYAKIHYLNSFKKDFAAANHLYNTLALEFANEELTNIKSSKHFQIERGKTLYGLQQFVEAIELLKDITVPEYLHHPIDLSLFYEKDAYLALCYMEINEKEKALEVAEKAVKNISVMPSTPYKVFIEEIYEQVKSRFS